MWIEIEHELRFEYDAYISESLIELRVEPQSGTHQTLRSFYLAVGPPAKAVRYLDWNGNAVHHFSVAGFHDRIQVLTRSLVETHPAHPALDTLTEPPPEALGPLYDFVRFGGPVQRSEALERLAGELAPPASAPLGQQIRALGQLLHGRFAYDPEATDFRSSSDHIIEEGGGVCQDFAHLALALLRLRQIPCRYVSGYLHLERSDDRPSQSHAWVEVADRDGRWAAFDPTHDQVPDERYVAVARARHYDDVPPNRGIFLGAAQEKLHAGVRTSETVPARVASLDREVGRIDLPVFRQTPRPLRPAPLEEQPGADEQQQQ